MAGRGLKIGSRAPSQQPQFPPGTIQRELEDKLQQNERTGNRDLPWSKRLISEDEFERTRTPGRNVVERGDEFKPRETLTTGDLGKIQNTVAIPLVGDTSAVGTLKALAGEQPASLLRLDGGFDYPLGANHGAWANAMAQAEGIRTGALNIMNKTGKPVTGVFMAMNPKSVDRTTMMRGLVDDMMARSTISDDELRKFEENLRKAKNPKGETEWASFPGFKDKAALDEWMKRPGNRDGMYKHMDMVSYYDAGFPNIAEARYALSDPLLRPLAMPNEMYGGQLLIGIDPKKPLRETSETKLPHPDYSHEIAKGVPPTRRDPYYGGFEVPIPRSLLFEPWYQKRRALGKPAGTDHRSFGMSSAISEKIPQRVLDQQAIDQLGDYIDATKKVGDVNDVLKRFKRGGNVKRNAYADPPSNKIDDWKWRPLEDVREDLAQPGALPQNARGEFELPQHVVPFGDFMIDQAKRADTEGLSPRDVAKAYGITVSSMQRQAINRKKLEDLGLPLSSPDRKIRPEGAFADWLVTPMGQRYLDAAVRGLQDRYAIEDAVRVMKPFGNYNKLGEQLAYGARYMPDAAGEISDLVARSSYGMSDPQEWRDFMKRVKNIDAAKSGFMSSMLGRGDNATLDARQLKLHTPDDTSSKYFSRGESLPVTGGDEAVHRLNERQRVLGVSMPSRFDPMYQHLTHHGVWDATSGTKTTHEDLMNAMRYEDGGKVEKDSERFKREADERIAADRAQYDRDIARRREQGGSAARRFLDQAAAGMRAQWSVLDDPSLASLITDEAKPVVWNPLSGKLPGIVYDVASTPTLVGMIPGGEALVPQFANDANEHMEKLRAAINSEMGIKPPSGPIEHAGAALGTMIGQVPLLPLSAPKRVADGARMIGPLANAARNVGGSAVEFFGPVVTPNIGRNVAIGTGFGTALGTGMEAMTGHADGGMVDGYADGGPVNPRTGALLRFAARIAGKTDAGKAPPTTREAASPAAPVISLDEARETKKVSDFHKSLMGGVNEMSRAIHDAGLKFHEEGLLPYPVGARFTSEKTRASGDLPYEVTGYYVDPKNLDRYGYMYKRGDDESGMLLLNDPRRESMSPEMQKTIADSINSWQLLDGPKKIDGYADGGPVNPRMGALVMMGRGRPRRVGEGTGYKSVPGKPATVEIPTIGRVETLPIPELEDAAARYMQSVGRPGEHVIREYPEFDEELARRLSRAYDEMKHDPSDPRVQRSYQALADETMAQLDKIKDSGLDIRFLKPGMEDPYARSPALGYADIVENNRLYTYPTDFGFGTTDANAELLSTFKHPLLTPIGRLGDKDNAVVNDAFRVVHDAFGHFGPGNPFFRHKGEERAWLNHAPMYSPDARPAAAVELRGQNSYLNFGPNAEHNAKASGADTIYADQKLGLMPEWASTEKSKKKAEPKDEVKKADGGPVELANYSNMSFGRAFRLARQRALSGGEQTFWWRGKKYGTQLKDEPARRPAAPATAPARQEPAAPMPVPEGGEVASAAAQSIPQPLPMPQGFDVVIPPSAGYYGDLDPMANQGGVQLGYPRERSPFDIEMERYTGMPYAVMSDTPTFKRGGRARGALRQMKSRAAR